MRAVKISTRSFVSITDLMVLDDMFAYVSNFGMKQQGGEKLRLITKDSKKIVLEYLGTTDFLGAVMMYRMSIYQHVMGHSTLTIIRDILTMSSFEDTPFNMGRKSFVGIGLSKEVEKRIIVDNTAVCSALT